LAVKGALQISDGSSWKYPFGQQTGGTAGAVQVPTFVAVREMPGAPKNDGFAKHEHVVVPVAIWNAVA
jgi:hypothetical protein